MFAPLKVMVISFLQAVTFTILNAQLKEFYDDQKVERLKTAPFSLPKNNITTYHQENPFSF